MLAGQVLGSAVFYIMYNKIFNSIKKQKDPQVIYKLLLMCSNHL